MVEPCRIAVVGAGPLVGFQHCEAVRALESQGVELACICQRRADDRKVADAFNLKLYTDAFEMAAEELLHGIVVSAPTHMHLPLVKAVITGAQKRQAELGETKLALRSLLIEKPIAEDLPTAMRLVEEAEKAGIIVLVGHQRRHSPFVRRAKELVQAPGFGPLRGLTAEFALLKPEPYFKKGDDEKTAWRTQRGKGGPILINLIHDIDLLRFITGHEVSHVFAATSGSARESDVEDTGAVTVVLDHGACGTFFFSDAAPSPWSYEFTTGENKKYPPVPGDDPKDCYHFMGAQKSFAFPSMRRYSYGKEVKEPGWDAPLTLDEASVDRDDPLRVQMAHFARVCRDEEGPICSGRDAMESLAVIMAVLRSAETQQVASPAEMLAEAALVGKGIQVPPVRRKVIGLPHVKSIGTTSISEAVSTFCPDNLRKSKSGGYIAEQATMCTGSIQHQETMCSDSMLNGVAEIPE